MSDDYLHKSFSGLAMADGIAAVADGIGALKGVCRLLPQNGSVTT